MYPFLLASHSLLRWLVLVSLVFSIVRAVRGWYGGLPFTGFDNFLRLSTATVTHIQLLLGLSLYAISPLSRFFLQDTGRAIHMREFRFFGLEHGFMMIIAVVVITAGSMKVKRIMDDKEKFRTMAIWFGIALLLIFTSIPWSFSPFTSRPMFRPFNF